jgi:hypothetical protein
MKRLLLGFVAGFLGVIIFHQAAVWLLHAAGVTPRGAWPMNPVPPFGVPAVISLSFWGGVWGAIMIPLIDGRRGSGYWIAALLFGALAPTLVAWFIVAPLKHQPIAAGWRPKAMLIGPIVNGVWGLATAMIYAISARSSLRGAGRWR